MKILVHSSILFVFFLVLFCFGFLFLIFGMSGS